MAKLKIIKITSPTNVSLVGDVMPKFFLIEGLKYAY